MSECNKTILLAKKMVHPRVVRALERISNISPGIMPRDSSQPKEGYLMQIKLQNLKMEIASTNKEIKKPETCLNLNSSLLRRRQLSMSLKNV